MLDKTARVFEILYGLSVRRIFCLFSCA